MHLLALCMWIPVYVGTVIIYSCMFTALTRGTSELRASSILTHHPRLLIAARSDKQNTAQKKHLHPHCAHPTDRDAKGVQRSVAGGSSSDAMPIESETAIIS